MQIAVDTLSCDGVRGLLEEHLADMYATSPPESVHALDMQALKHESITFWSARENNRVLGCVALKRLSDSHGEIKSMRSAPNARHRGVASALLQHLLIQANQKGLRRLSLETGTMDYFEPAKNLYRKFGFVECSPFADYSPDPNSCFMTLLLKDK
ncbi:GNAT family N-acetyltransferase [Paraglaciecola sp. 20A4]|uniref:GNAT family N-acetyltransferase n=1 Tax=Paraglaciecola sp. 20A4 TaxID=2687288 RepID=UPI0014087A6D|nr:GNAT family N-acetyltransferase [Paraglaciecola sp. 20A4]